MRSLSASTFAKLAAVLCLFVIAANLVSLFILDSTHQTAANNLTRIHSTQQAVTSARETQVAFKNQVHEWKNILLRGQNPEAFATYRAAFEAAEADTRVKLKELTKAFTVANLGTLPSDLEQDHRTLTKTYQDALNLYQSDNPASILTVDSYVRGIDRKLTADLDQLASSTERHAQELLQSLQLQAAQRRELHTLLSWSFSGLTVFAVLAFAIVASFRTTG
ncbi:MAG: hypothetical protein OHK005_08720 [Candidatus Methylacidiphilales bacterium]